MIVTVDAGSRQLTGAVIFEAWKLGVEAEKLDGSQVELCSADDNRIDMILNKFKSVKVLHTELIKEVSIHESN
jgi:hypothetical protein